jgi:hypothetical protein
MRTQVNGDAILDGTIQAIDLADGSVTVAKLATGVLTSINSLTPTGGTLSITGGLTLTGNGSARHWMLGDSLGNANIANVWVSGTPSGTTADRPLNFIDTAAVMKIVRVGGNPALELQEWDSTITTQIAYWDIVSISGDLQIRDRSAGASNIWMTISKATGNMTVGNLFSPSITSNITGCINDSMVVGGASDAITLTSSTSITSYVEGQEFTFRAVAANVTGSATINIDGLGALTLNMGSVTLPIGGLISGNIYRARIEGTGPFIARITPYDALSSNGDTINGSLMFVAGTYVIGLPTGTTAQRISSPFAGAFRFNTDAQNLEYYNGTQWEFLVDGVAGSGVMLQSIISSITAQSGTTNKAVSNVVPLSTDGTQIWTTTITPSATTSKILIQGGTYVDHGTSGRKITFAFFRGTTCIGTSVTYIATTLKGVMLPFAISDSPASTSATTYSIRCFADNNGTWYVAQGATALYGGMLAQNDIIIQELA